MRTKLKNAPISTTIAFAICACMTIAFAFESVSAQEISFKKLKKNKNLKIKNCSIFTGTLESVTTLIVLKGGKKVRLPLSANRQVAKLGKKKFRYFNCSDNVLSGKTSLDSTAVSFDLSEDDFPVKPESSSALDDVCPNIRNLTGSEIYKTPGSDHFPKSDCRRYTASFIVLNGGPSVSTSCIPVYDSEGNKITSFGAYYPAGAYKYRAYQCYGCSSGTLDGPAIAKLAKKNTGSEEIYLKTGSQCIRVPNPNKCYNSSAC